jgi:hypothetical protein
MAQTVAPTPTESFIPDDSLSPDEVRTLIDRQARRYLGISGEEFLRRWHRGEYADDSDRPGLIRLALLVPFAE